MKQIDLTHFLRLRTREVVRDLTKAAYRDDKRTWEDSNTTKYIQVWLNSFGHDYTTSDIRTMMRNLVDKGYAYMEKDEAAKRTKKFGFLPGVDLSYLLHDDNLPINTNHHLTYAIGDEFPPLPGEEEKPVYRLNDINSLLRIWFGLEPDKYKSWVDASIETLANRIQKVQNENVNGN
jgi:hypothetical protein